MDTFNIELENDQFLANHAQRLPEIHRYRSGDEGLHDDMSILVSSKLDGDI